MRRGILTPVAILDDDGDASNGGSLKCWGSKHAYGPGDSTPLGDTKIIDITVGDADYTCAILSDGNVKCWGNNDHGQTGGGTQDISGSLTLSGTAGDPLSGGTAKHIAAGGSHTCAILSDGTVKCWGYNYYPAFLTKVAKKNLFSINLQ